LELKFKTVCEKMSENLRGDFLTHTVEDQGRRPRNDVACTYGDHLLDHVRLNLVGVVLSGTWSRSSVAGHDASLTTNDNQDATTAENEDEKLKEKEKGDVQMSCASAAVGLLQNK